MYFYIRITIFKQETWSWPALNNSKSKLLLKSSCSIVTQKITGDPFICALQNLYIILSILKWNPQEPLYNATRYKAIFDTTQFFLGSQIIFKKSVELCTCKFTYFRLHLNWKYWIYTKYGRILTKIFKFRWKNRFHKGSGD